MQNLRDRCWLWTHDAGSQNKGWGLPGASRITPAEAAFYMGIPNVIMVRHFPESMPASVQYSLPFRPLKQVVWSIVGAGGITDAQEREEVIQLASDLPNMTGVMMDDFFNKNEGDADALGALPLEEVRQIRTKLASGARKLDLWCVLYGHQLDLPFRSHLELCDKLTFWTWEAKDLDRLEENFAAAEELVPPNCGKLLGCYMWDYGGKKPMPVEQMKYQCETGLAWLKQGRIEGIIFLASCICDLDLETVEWSKRWIAGLE